MRMRRPKTVWILLLYFSWLEGRQFFSIVFPTTSASYLFYSALDLLWVHYLLAVGTVALCGWILYGLWYARPTWLLSTLVAFSLLAVSTVLSTWYSVRHIDLMRSTYVESRVARGFPVREQTLDAVVKPEILLYGAAGTVMLYGVMALAAWRRRDYGTSAHDAIRPEKPSANAPHI